MAMCMSESRQVGITDSGSLRLSYVANDKPPVRTGGCGLFLIFRCPAAATTGRNGFSDLLTLPCVTFTNACRLATKVAQIVQLGAADVSFLHDVNVIDDSCVQRENSFDADTEAGLAHGDRFARATMLAGDANSFERLQAFFSFGFFDPNVNTDGVTRLEIRDVIS